MSDGRGQFRFMDTWPAHAVVLPGTGSDAAFAAEAFADALALAGTRTTAVEPDPTRVVESYEAALDEAALQYGRIIVGGVSIGAAVAASWALRNPEHVFGILAALPPWLGSAQGAPAALSAVYTATALRNDGLGAVIDAMAATSPAWLASTLRRSWTSQWPDLPSALDEAAVYTAPDLSELARSTIRTSIVAAVDDPVHPHDVAIAWHGAIARSSLATVTLTEIGADPSVLGRRAVEGLSALGE